MNLQGATVQLGETVTRKMITRPLSGLSLIQSWFSWVCEQDRSFKTVHDLTQDCDFESIASIKLYSDPAGQEYHIERYNLSYIISSWIWKWCSYLLKERNITWISNNLIKPRQTLSNSIIYSLIIILLSHLFMCLHHCAFRLYVIFTKMNCYCLPMIHNLPTCNTDRSYNTNCYLYEI